MLYHGDARIFGLCQLEGFCRVIWQVVLQSRPAKNELLIMTTVFHWRHSLLALVFTQLAFQNASKSNDLENIEMDTIPYSYSRWKIGSQISVNLTNVNHYNDVIMSMIASQIISLAMVYSTVYSDSDQRKHQSTTSLAFVRGIHRDRWIPRTKGQLRGKCFHLMTSSWYICISKILLLQRIAKSSNSNSPHIVLYTL